MMRTLGGLQEALGHRDYGLGRYKTLLEQTNLGKLLIHSSRHNSR
ncbi:hypothetical protein RchiOBHm_Chr3g0459801 [Rosa chinensis]|uniref:Uncharacterized protein n=1 Tax=Rosa chinensis TaxID=74649 RepID=A0A2P6R887_ROSCH|nr:hypothetical protein RchiOBHm_Chr3g0459801 [Rosa chinensis]